MENKKRLFFLLNNIKEATGFTDKEISKSLDYRPDYITVSISTGNVSKKLIQKLELVYKDVLKDVDLSLVQEPDVELIRKKPNEKVIIKDGLRKIYESQLRQESRQMVIRNFLAEIYAKIYERPSTVVLSEMEELEKQSASKLQGELKLK